MCGWWIAIGTKNEPGRVLLFAFVARPGLDPSFLLTLEGFTRFPPVNIVLPIVEPCRPVLDESLPLEQTSDNFRFSAAVAGFGMLLRDSEFKGDATYPDMVRLARNAMGEDEAGYRLEFVHLVETAELLDN